MFKIETENDTSNDTLKMAIYNNRYNFQITTSNHLIFDFIEIGFLHIQKTTIIFNMCYHFDHVAKYIGQIFPFIPCFGILGHKPICQTESKAKPKLINERIRFIFDF